MVECDVTSRLDVTLALPGEVNKISVERRRRRRRRRRLEAVCDQVPRFAHVGDPNLLDPEAPGVNPEPS